VSGRGAVLAGLGVALVAFVAVPLATLLPTLADAPPGTLSAALGEGRAAWNTARLCAGALCVALIAGVPTGLALARARLPRWLGAACALPYAVPPYVTTLAWIQLANPTNGALTAYVPLDVYSLPGMCWVLGLHLSPLVALSVRDALGAVDPALEEAARVSGASPLRVARDVTLPMIAPALAASSAFVVGASAASFGVPYLLGMPAATPVPVLTTRIYQALELDPVGGRPLAVMLALALLLVGTAVPALLRLAEGRRAYATARAGRARTPVPSTFATAGVCAYLLVAVGLPLASVVMTSVRARAGAPLAPDGLTTAHWAAVLGDPRTREALLRSLGLAAAAATASVVSGGLLAHAAERGGSRLARGLAAFARVGWTLPGTLLALAMILAFSQEIRLIVADRVTFVLALADTVWLLGIAYVVKLLALPVDATRAATRALHPSLEEAARVSGASWARTLRDVTVPLLAPALTTAWFLVFVPSFCEVTLSVLLRGPRTEVLGTRLFMLQGYGDPAEAAVLALVAAAASLLGLAARGLTVRGTSGGAA
jgi:iron(III) transport system permease protein